MRMPISPRCVPRGSFGDDGPRLMPTHAERQIVPYQADQLFELVADVGKYPQFLPWCVAARVRSRSGDELVADLTVGFGPFRYMNNQWVFIPHPQGCEVDFFVDFEFRSRILQAAIGVVFNEAVRRMVGAFRKRAREVYGPPIVPDGAPEAAKT